MNADKLQNKMMNGNEAVAWAAISAGVDYFSHYPGSPVNKVEPEIKRLSAKFNLNITFNDCLNEHIAALNAAGACFCGARALLVMKHVGVNIASDPFNYIGYTGIKGGMVIVVGTDPGANSSTGEEDIHWYVPQFNFPLYEPTSVKEIYDYVQKGFDLSEEYSIPVFIFIPGRLCFNSDTIRVPSGFTNYKKRRNFHFQKNTEKYINVGNRAVQNHRLLLERIDKLSRNCNYSKSFFKEESEIGVITRGSTFSHTFESIVVLDLEDKVHLLNLDMVYPINEDIIKKFVDGKKEVIIIEDQDGFLELHIKAALFNTTTCQIDGKKFFPKYGEILFDQVHLFLSEKYNIKPTPKLTPGPDFQVPERLGTFCEGCPHRSSFYAIKQALEGTLGIIGGDIGCSSLPPFRADWLMCMNAGIGISQGISHVSSDSAVVSTGGEGTFFHGGILSLQNAVLNNIRLLHIVFDNHVVAMTGRQPSPTTLNRVNYKKLLKSIGVKRLFIVSAVRPKRLTKIIKREIRKDGVKVIWVNTPCAQTPSLLTKIKRHIILPIIETNRCGECSLCYDQLSCPAIIRTFNHHPTYRIDSIQCQRCGACKDLCPNRAIKSSIVVPLSGAIHHALKLMITRLKEIRHG